LRRAHVHPNPRRFSRETQGIRNHDQRRPSVGEDREPQARVTEHREDQEDGFNREREANVELDHPQRAAAKMNRFGNVAQIVFQRRDVGSFDGVVAARCAHRNAGAAR